MTVHTAGDGIGPREVLVNGKPVENVFFADTGRGIVRFYRYPFRLDKYKKRVLSGTIRGSVEVREKESL